MERPKTCMNCGTPLGENVRFCPTCGAPAPNTGYAGYPAASVPKAAPENVPSPAVPAKKRRTPLIIAILAAAVILFGVGGFFLGRTFAVPGSEPATKADRKNSSDGKSTAEPKKTDRSAAPDPAAAALAIADKEFTELIAGITEERVELYSTDAEVIAATERIKERMSAGDREIRLYSVTLDEDFPRSAEEFFPYLTAAVSASNNAYGIVATAASAVAQKLNLNNSYCYPGDADGNTLYLAELRNDETVTACMICLVNGHHAIETLTIPVFAEDFAPRQLVALAVSELPEGKKPTVKRLQSETLPLKEDTAAILERLTPLKAGKEKVEALIEETAGKAAEHAEPSYLAKINAPEEVIPLCQTCSVFGDTPKLTWKWDLSGLSKEEIGKLLLGAADATAGFSEQELRNMLLTTLPQFIARSYSRMAEIIATSLISVGTSASGLKPADAGVYWLFYETDEEETVVLSISIIENGNGCCDISAVPILYDEAISLGLEYAEDGNADLRAFLRALFGG